MYVHYFTYSEFPNVSDLLQPYALAIAMFSLFSIFIVELVAFRWGTAKLAKLGVVHGMTNWPFTFLSPHRVE